jgi:CRP/FNR family cyclic AMP-dependent transcriptional regulator
LPSLRQIEQNRPMAGAPVEALQRVPLFAGVNKRDLARLAKLFHERTIASGQTLVEQGGRRGFNFFLVDEGVGTVTVDGEERGTVKPGDYFGELAVIDFGERSATITAQSDMRCYTLAAWEFRPFVESNGAVAWQLLERMAALLREARGAGSNGKR